MAEERRTVHSVEDTIEQCMEAGLGATDVVHDVNIMIRTVVDQECGTLQEHRELGLRILKRLAVSPVGPRLEY